MLLQSGQIRRCQPTEVGRIYLSHKVGIDVSCTDGVEHTQMQLGIALQIIVIPKSQIDFMQGDEVILHIEIGSQSGHLQATVLLACLEVLDIGMNDVGRIGNVFGFEVDA